jgi:hypothetical protein
VIVLVIDPAITRADIPVLCARLADLVRPCGAGGVIVCDVSAIVDGGAVVVDALARLRLTAQRLGADIRVRGMPLGLRQLLVFTGLDEIVLIDGASALEPQRQAEQREQPLDVEEVGDGADPSA